MPLVKSFSVTNLVNSDGCFDLQFRKDVRRERTNSPTYYRWKAQFIVTSAKENIKVLKKIQKEIGCGKIHISKDQARYSVQNISEIFDTIVPFFKRNSLKDKKKKDFALWSRAIEIIHRNKGKYLAKWKKNDLLSLIQIQKSSSKYKNNPKKLKWIDVARDFVRTM